MKKISSQLDENFRSYSDLKVKKYSFEKWAVKVFVNLKSIKHCKTDPMGAHLLQKDIMTDPEEESTLLN